MVTALCILCGTLLAFFLILYFGFYVPALRENAQMNRTLDYYRSTHLRKQGGTTMLKGFDNLSYDLRSWDAGNTWYAVKDDWRGNTFTILGEADSVYPDLLRHLEAMDRLTNYVEKNGSIGSKDSITKSEINMLEEIGLEVRQN